MSYPEKVDAVHTINRFTQKNMFKNPIKDISGKKPLETGNQTLPFDKDTYNQFMLKALTLK